MGVCCSSLHVPSWKAVGSPWWPVSSFSHVEAVVWGKTPGVMAWWGRLCPDDMHSVVRPSREPQHFLSAAPWVGPVTCAPRPPRHNSASLCCRWSVSGRTPSPPPAPWPGLSRCSPTAQVLHGAQTRRSLWSFSWWDKTTGQWKCPLCKWVSGRSHRVPGPPRAGPLGGLSRELSPPSRGRREACRHSQEGPEAFAHAWALAPSACSRFPGSVLLSSIC